METQTTSFEAEFQRRVQDIKDRADKVGLNLTKLCKAANIARATPDRWRNETPLTVRLIDRMDGIVAEHEAKSDKQA